MRRDIECTQKWVRLIARLACRDLDRRLPKRYGTTVPTAVGLASEAALHGCRAFAACLPFTFHFSP